MTDPGYVHYILIVDRSGSMSTIKNDTQGGIRSFAEEQGKLPGKQTLSLYQFDDQFETVTFFGKTGDVEKYELIPRGMTALYGAIGTALDNEGEKLSATPENDRPGKVVVVIATDGAENYSRVMEWSRKYADPEIIKTMITHQQDVYDWKFTYIGANQDAITEAGKIGIPGYSTMDYAVSHAGSQAAWDGASNSSADYVSGRTANVSYGSRQRKEALKEDEEK